MYTESVVCVACHVESLAIFSWSAPWSAHLISLVTIIIFAFTMLVLCAPMITQMGVRITMFMIYAILNPNARLFADVIIWVTFFSVFTVCINVATYTSLVNFW